MCGKRTRAIASAKTAHCVVAHAARAATCFTVCLPSAQRLCVALLEQALAVLHFVSCDARCTSTDWRRLQWRRAAHAERHSEAQRRGERKQQTEAVHASCTRDSSRGVRVTCAACSAPQARHSRRFTPSERTQPAAQRARLSLFHCSVHLAAPSLLSRPATALWIRLFSVVVAVGVLLFLGALLHPLAFPSPDPFAEHCAQTVIVESYGAVVDFSVASQPLLSDLLQFSSVLHRILRRAGMKMLFHQLHNRQGMQGHVVHTFYEADNTCVNQESMILAVQHQMQSFLKEQRPPFPTPPKGGYEFDRYQLVHSERGAICASCREKSLVANSRASNNMFYNESALPL